MKWGLFGDSYVEVRPIYSGNSWPELLDWDADNYGLGGSGIDYSYWQWYRNHEQYDRCIFLISQAHRRTLFERVNYRAFGEHSIDYGVRHQLQPVAVYHSNGALPNTSANARGDIEYQIPESAHPHIQADIDKWIDYNDANELLPAAAMINHIQAVRPDTIILHTFWEYSLASMINISSLDSEQEFNTWQEDHAQRPCHMSFQQNREFAGYLKQHVQGKIDIEHTLHRKNVRKFYTTSPSLEKAGLIR